MSFLLKNIFHFSVQLLSKRDKGFFLLTFFFLSVLFLSFSSCTEKPREINPAFYHWQTEFALSSFGKKYLDSLSVQKLYVKFFDVDKEKGALIPKAIFYGDSLAAYFENKEIVPTVFITNRSLKNISKEENADLAEKITAKIDYLSTKNELQYREVQLDCDWTISTKEAYFKLIENIKSKLTANIQISATIRLHQVKFVEKTGVPPVDRGVLMYYNMGNVEDPDTGNSILDNEIGQQYLQNINNYPLVLDVALPIFAWGVLFRDGQMIRLINDLREEEMNDTVRFRRVDSHHFEVEKSTYLKGYFLYPKDEIRVENITQSELENTVDLLADALYVNDQHIIFYHLDSTNLVHFPTQNLKKILDAFK